jgi:hypothetical protein
MVSCQEKGKFIAPPGVGRQMGRTTEDPHDNPRFARRGCSGFNTIFRMAKMVYVHGLFTVCSIVATGRHFGEQSRSHMAVIPGQSKFQSYLRRSVGRFPDKSRDGHAEQPDGFLHWEQCSQ